MKKKSLLSMLLVLSMIISTIIPVSADYTSAGIIDGKTVPGWEGALASTGGADLKGIQVGITDGDAKSGSLSLCAIFPNKSLTSNNYYLTNTDIQVSVKAGKTYTVGVWYKVDTAVKDAHKAWTFFAVGEPTGNIPEDIYELSKTESGNQDGWRHRYLTFTAKKDETGPLRFGFCPNFSHVTDRTEVKFLFDDIYFREEGSDVNFVYNPSFEEAVEEPETPEDSEQTVAGWSGLQSTDENGATTTVVSSSETATRTGERSLSVTFQAGTTGYKEYIQNTTAQVTLKAGVEYEIGYWYQYYAGMASTGNAKPFIAIGEVTDSSKVTIGAFSADKPADGGWRQVYASGNFTPEEDMVGYVSFGFNVKDLAVGSTILIDDVYIRAVGSDENLIPNPSFEEAVEEPEIPEEPPVVGFEPEITEGKTMQGWSGLANSSGEDKGVRVGATDYVTRTGDLALYANFPNKKTWQKDYIINTNAPVTVKAGKKYNFGIWYKTGDDVTKPQNCWPFMSVGTLDNLYLEINTKGETVDGWTLLSGTATATGDATGDLYFGFESNFSHITDKTEIKFVFDDIYLKEDGSDINLIANDSFEETWEAPGKPMEGWSELVTTDGDHKGVRVKSTEVDAKSGISSLSVKFPNTKTYQKHYIKNTLTQVTLKAGKTYKFGVWYKVDDAVTKQHQSWPFFAIGGVDTIWDLSTTETETVNGWKHRWGTVTVEEDIKGSLYFGFDPNFSHVTDREQIEILFDDIYFCEEGTEANFVYNPSFEETLAEPFNGMDGWSEPVTTGGDHKGVRINTTEEDVKSGDSSLSVIFPNVKTYQKHYINNTNTQVTLKAGKTYKFGVWYKVDDAVSKQHQSWPFFAIGGVDTVWDLSTTETELEDGWKHRWGTVTVEEDMTGALYFGFDPNFSHVTDRIEIKVLFDDIYFCEDGTDENLVYNPSFEETYSEPTISIDGWSEPITTGGDHKGVRIKSTDKDSVDGNYALSVKFPNAKTYQKHYVSNTTGDITLEAGKTYKFGVWYKVDDAVTKQHQSWPFFAIGGVDTVWDLSTTETETVNGWKHRWGTVTVEEDMTGALYFGFDPNFAHITDRTEIEFLFDDIYFCEEGTDKNLVYNGSFEIKEWSVIGYEYDVISGDEVVKSDIKSLEEGNNAEVLGKIKIQNIAKEDFNVAVAVALYENNKLIDLSFVEQNVPIAAEAFETGTIGCSVSVPQMDPEKKYQIKLMLWNSMTDLTPLTEANIFE